MLAASASLPAAVAVAALGAGASAAAGGVECTSAEAALAAYRGAGDRPSQPGLGWLLTGSDTRFDRGEDAEKWAYVAQRLEDAAFFARVLTGEQTVEAQVSPTAEESHELVEYYLVLDRLERCYRDAALGAPGGEADVLVFDGRYPAEVRSRHRSGLEALE